MDLGTGRFVVHFIFKQCLWSKTKVQSSAVGDPRRPYPTDLEMRQGFLGMGTFPDHQKHTHIPQTATGNEQARFIDVLWYCVLYGFLG